MSLLAVAASRKNAVVDILLLLFVALWLFYRVRGLRWRGLHTQVDRNERRGKLGPKHVYHVVAQCAVALGGHDQ